MKKCKILFVDNNSEFLNPRSELIEAAGFEVLKALTLEEAEQFLRDIWVHVVILDVRMLDDDNPRDWSGLTLARKEAYRRVPKIILTGFRDHQVAVEALRLEPDGPPLAVDFLLKTAGDEVLIQAVERTLTQFVRINWNLKFRPSVSSLFLQLANLIAPTSNRAHLLDRADELEDLFRKLFFDYTSVIIGRLFTQSEGQILLELFAYKDSGPQEQFVVSCVQRRHDEGEDPQHEKSSLRVIDLGSAAKNITEETVRFAAAAYKLNDGDLEEMMTFSEFCKRRPIKEIRTALEHLYNTTLAPRYRRDHVKKRFVNLKEFYQAWLGSNQKYLVGEELEFRVKALCEEVSETGLTQLNYLGDRVELILSGGLELSYPGPISGLFEKPIVFDTQISHGSTPGQLNGDSILIDCQGRTWLIDLNRSVQKPLLADFSCIETAIKLNLFANLDISVWHEIEKRLLSVSHLEEKIDIRGSDTNVEKAIQAISFVRRKASALISCDLESYLASLLFGAVDQLISYNPPKIDEPKVRHIRRELRPYLHSLLSAAILYERLIPSPVSEVILIDKLRRKIRIGAIEADLSNQEFDLLCCLCEHPKQYCSRKMLADKLVTDIDNIFALISRLRKKIEPSPKRGKYIETLRGDGYILKINCEFISD
jgi:DNA-binding response OmpR family regulator